MSDLKNLIPSVASAQSILTALAQKSDTAKGLAASSCTSISTTYRILKTLETRDWVRQLDGGRYELSAGLLPLLTHLHSMERLLAAAQPILDELAGRLEVTAKLSLRQGDQQVTVAVGMPRIPIAVLVPPNVPYPVVQASTGAVLLAGLPDAEWRGIAERTPSQDWRHDCMEKLVERIRQCREHGRVENLRYNPMGLDSMAVPVYIDGHRMALSIIGFRETFSDEQLPNLRNGLLAARENLQPSKDMAQAVATS